MRNKNKEVKKKPATTQDCNEEDTMEASTLEEWWQKTSAMVLAALEKDEDQKARDQLLKYH
eukprot:16434227-Heterocapsa_arctica.AAC.1